MSENGTAPPQELPYIPDGAKIAALNQRVEKLRADVRIIEDNADVINAWYISEQHKAMVLGQENSRLVAENARLIDLLNKHGIDPNEDAKAGEAVEASG